ncbi:THAP-type domain-containing protein, partial [Aphis craccivora]
FYSYVSELDTIFVTNFPTLAIENDVGKKLKNLVDNVPFNQPCPKFDVEYLKALYIRLRIFHTIKYLNKNLLSTGRKSRKLDILTHL